MAFLIIVFFFWTVFLNDEVINNEFLTLYRIVAHIVGQQFLHFIVLMKGDLLKADVWSDESCKLLWGYFAKTLKACYLGVGSQVLDSLLTLFVAIAITCDEITLFAILAHLLLTNLGATVTDAEQWGLQHIDVTFLDQFGEEFQEERDEQQTDVHTIDIGIGSHNHLHLHRHR